MEDIITNASAFADLGATGIIVAVVLWIVTTFGEDIRAIVKSIPERKAKRDQIIENNTAALNLVTEALHNNTEVLKSVEAERAEQKILIEKHDEKSTLQFTHLHDAIKNR